MIIFTILAVFFMLLAVAFTIYAYVSISVYINNNMDLPPYFWIVPAILWALYILFQNLVLITLR